MSATRDLCFLSATELVRLYRARKVSPLDVMQALVRGLVEQVFREPESQFRAAPIKGRPAGSEAGRRRHQGRIAAPRRRNGASESAPGVGGAHTLSARFGATPALSEQVEDGAGDRLAVRGEHLAGEGAIVVPPCRSRLQ